MRKILILLTALLTFGAGTAEAETIYTGTAKEYADAIEKYAPQSTAALFSMGIQSDEPGNIILACYDGIADCRGALYDIYDEYGIHTLIYNTSGEAAAAYEYYNSIGISVCYNEEMTVAASRPTAYFPYLSWGSGYVNTSWLTSQLELHFGDVAAMPEITVVEIDSGIDYTHPELDGRIDVEQGYDYANNDSDPMDDVSHGTHVAGIIADNTTSNVKIIPLKVTKADGLFTTTQLKSAIQRANELKPSVINMSIGTTETDSDCSQKEVFKPLFDKANENKTIICAAAGNGKLNADYIFPAYMDNVITVANSTKTGGLASTSNYGSVIELAAPGDSIYSTIPVSMGSYGVKNGTSMACPFVTAAVAMMKTFDNDIEYDSASEILQANTTPFSAAPANSYGSGILNMTGLIPAIPTPSPTPSPTPEPTAPPTPTPEPTAAPTVVPQDYGVSIIIESTDSGSLYITATRVIPDFCSLYAAEYDEDGILAGLVKDCNETIIHPSESAACIKVFLWDNAHNNLPLTGVTVYPLTEKNNQAH